MSSIKVWAARIKVVTTGIPGFVLGSFSKESANGQVNLAGRCSAQLFKAADKAVDRMVDLEIEDIVKMGPGAAKTMFDDKLARDANPLVVIALALKVANDNDLLQTALLGRVDLNFYGDKGVSGYNGEQHLLEDDLAYVKGLMASKFRKMKMK